MNDPAPTLVLYAYAVLGAMLLWTKITAQKKKLNSFGDVIEQLVPSTRAQYVIQFVIFIFLGALVGMIAVVPITASHALAAGMAWSRLAARD